MSNESHCAEMDMSQRDLTLTSDPVPAQPDAAAWDFAEAFCLSAESALRDEAVTSPFSEIKDKGVRRRLASELFLSGDALGPGWMAMFRTSIGDLAATMPLEAATCHPWLRGKQGGEADETWIPMGVLRYMCVLDEKLSGRRKSAHSAFPFLIWLAIVEAHSTGPMSRVRAAWAVLDGIDRGKRLLPLLCNFLRVSKSAAQMSVRLLAFPWELKKGWNVARRLLRVMAAMPHKARPSAVTDQSPSVLPMLYLSVVAGAAGVAMGRLFPLSRGVCATLGTMRRVAKKERSIRLRREAKMLRALGARGWVSRRERDIAAPWPLAEPTVTPSGWDVIPIKGYKALVVEGHEMSHCAATYSKKLRRGHAVVLSLRSQALGQRATLVVEDLSARSPSTLGEGFTLDEEFADVEELGHVPWLRVTLAGPGNSGPSFAAYRTALEILETFPQHELSISIRGNVRRGTDLQSPACMSRPQESSLP